MALLQIHPQFMTSQECDVLLALARKSAFLGAGVSEGDPYLSEEERSAVFEFEAKVAKITNCPRHDSEGRATFKLTTPTQAPPKMSQSRSVFNRTSTRKPSRHSSTSSEESSCDEDYKAELISHDDNRLPNGIHVDTHNGQDSRFVSIILYLNSLPHACGGETVFPQQAELGAVLLSTGASHTAMCEGHQAHGVASTLLAAAAEICHSDVTYQIEHHCKVALRRCGQGVGVCPQKGLAVVFYTRHHSTGGRVNPASWHGGASTAGAEKYILQKFKSVPTPDADSEEGIVRAVCKMTLG